MPSYQIEFVGGGELNQAPTHAVCVSDRQALDWASNLLAHHLGAEVSSDGRKVGWVTTSDNRAGVSVVLAHCQDR
jgi:hypothetical protein